MTVKEGDNSSSLLNSIDEEALQEIKTIALDFLQKAGLTELSEKLASLSHKEKAG